VSHASTNIRIKNIRRITASRFAAGLVSKDEDNVDDAGDTKGRCREARVKKSAGDENERLGGKEVCELDDGGKRKDLVDQVLTRCRGVSDTCLYERDVRRSSMKDGWSEVGVDGGVFAEANTSNWCER